MSRFAECGGSTVECFAVQAHEHPICAGESALVVLQDGITLVNSSIIVGDPEPTVIHYRRREEYYLKLQYLQLGLLRTGHVR